MRKLILSCIFSGSLIFVQAQNKAAVKPRPLTLSEYEKAKTYTIKDLDKDTYAKFENAYILDRYEMRKPYIIIGDDGAKKRIDLYKLISKEGMDELGTLVFYTNENGKVYTALQPNFTADTAVWNRYFTDIDDINKEEKNFVLKLSYILSKEMSFQLYKAINEGKVSKDEAATYGTNICFPGNQAVAMADGSLKLLNNIKAGDNVVTIDPTTKKKTVATVSKLVKHEAKNYAITKLLVMSAQEKITATVNEVKLTYKILSATPNHPMVTAKAKKKMGDIAIGDEVICLNEKTNLYEKYVVYNKTEAAEGVQKVYNMELNSGNTFIMNGVMVMQK